MAARNVRALTSEFGAGSGTARGFIVAFLEDRHVLSQDLTWDI
jgi:hypothetical protein